MIELKMGTVIAISIVSFIIGELCTTFAIALCSANKIFENKNEETEDDNVKQER